MTTGVTIVDYGIGNLFNLDRAFQHLKVKTSLITDPDSIRRAERLVIPGVGAFGEGIGNIDKLALAEPIREFAKTGKPMLGICLGMQLLASTSTELGNWKGLNVVGGAVVKFPAGPWKLPLISWCPVLESNGLNPWSGSILDGLTSGADFYFNHSYHLQLSDPASVLASANYAGTSFTAVLRQDNVFACQFHPERSAHAGLRLLSNFAKLSF
jgi:glutamine amidotransferase